MNGLLNNDGNSMSYNRILVASNTLPVMVTRDREEITISPEPFPIESSLEGLVGKVIKDYKWVGWPHCEVTDQDKDIVEELIKKENSRFEPIFLEQQDINNYYKGFCKIALWSLLHYQLNYVRLKTEWWDSYVTVNQLFCNRLVKLYQPGDMIWVHDYHLMLVPLMLRKQLPKNVPIGFFFHAPFPSYELFRILPNRKEILKGILGSDLIGFQSFEYLRHFKSSCARLLDLESNAKGIEVVVSKIESNNVVTSVSARLSLSKSRGGNSSTSSLSPYNSTSLPSSPLISPLSFIEEAEYNHFVKLQVYPIGCDFTDFMRHLESENVKERVSNLTLMFKGKKIILARDRLDSIEGVPKKLEVIENILSKYPEQREKLVFIQIYEPILEQNNESFDQKSLHKTVNEMVGRINGKFGTINSTPILYINRKIDQQELTAMYRIADVALITPLRDGMNLTSHEYVVCQKDRYGVLVLSEFTGAARCLGGAIIVNPFAKQEITKAVLEALEMPLEEKQLKHAINYNYVLANTSDFWSRRILHDLYEVRLKQENQNSHCTNTIPHLNSEYVIKSYSETKTERYFFLDYDGTLAPLVKHPSLAGPSKELIHTLEKLTNDPRNQVYVISGRDRTSLEGWLGSIPVGMSCEHGGLFRPPGHNQEWQENQKLDVSWKETVLAIMQDFEDRTPGSFVEIKQIGLTWHYRSADPEFSEYQASELMAQLRAVANKYPLDILAGKKAIEVKPIGVNKGSIIKMILSNHMNRKSSTSLFANNIEFILCCGDDKTDEDMFKELSIYYNENGNTWEEVIGDGLDQNKHNGCFTVKVLSEGSIPTSTTNLNGESNGQERVNTFAKNVVDSPKDVIKLLKALSACDQINIK